MERGKFTRICVEINLTKPVVGKVWLDSHWYKGEYEGLHLICVSCGCYDHLACNYTVQLVTTVEDGGSQSQTDQSNQGGKATVSGTEDKGAKNKEAKKIGGSQIMWKSIFMGSG